MTVSKTARVDGGRLRRTLNRRGVRVSAQVVVGLGLAAAILGLLAYFTTARGSVTLGFAAFSPYLMTGAPLAVLLCVLFRQRALGALALVVTLVAVSTQSRLFVASTGYRDGVTVVVMTSNLKLGEGDARSVVAAVRRHRVDVLMLQELTPDEQDRIDQAGLTSLLPYHVSEPALDARGTGLWSRYPLTQTTMRTDFVCAFVTARAQIPGVAGTTLLVAAHMAGPWPASGLWQRDIAHLPGVLKAIDGGGPMLVGADLNSTPDVAQFRRVLRAGVRDAAQQAGAGLTNTFPADTWYPPMIAIDHVLTRRAIGRRVETVEIPGSDHRALVATVQLPGAAQPG